MKKLNLIILLSFIIISCSSNNEENLIKESGQIMNDYVDTLEWSIWNAKDVKNLIEINQDKLQDSINSIK